MVGFFVGGVVPMVGVIPAVGETVTVFVGAGVGVVRVGSTVGEIAAVGEAAMGVWLTGVDVPTLPPVGILEDVLGVFDATGVVTGARVVCDVPAFDGLCCLFFDPDTTVVPVL